MSTTEDTGHVNPDCQGGKHAACAGDGWDDETDRRVECSCECHGPIGEVPPAVLAYESRLDVTRAEIVRLTGERDAALAEAERLRAPKITDITFTVEGVHGIDDPLIEDYLDEVHDVLESKLDGGVLLSSQVSNEDGETFRSVVADRDAAEARLRAVEAGVARAVGEARHTFHGLGYPQAVINVLEDLLAQAFAVLSTTAEGNDRG